MSALNALIYDLLVGMLLYAADYSAKLSSIEF
jgi:hypothetical protein